MKIALLTSLFALSSIGIAQNYPKPWETPSRKSSFFIGGSYGFASSSPEDAIDVEENFFTPVFNDVFGENFIIQNKIDAVNVEYLASLEFGVVSEFSNNLEFIFSGEILFSDASDTLIDGSGISSYEITNFGFLVNARVAYNFSPYLKVYAGGGIGFLSSDLDINSDIVDRISGFGNFSGQESIFVWQATAGLELKPVEHIGLFVQYRYLGGEDYDDLNFTAIDDSFVDVGARFYF